MLRTCFLLGLIVSANGYAATDMPTGAEGDTYYAIGKDIAKMTPRYGVELKVKSSVGSIDNIRQLLKDENVIFSLAQSDVIAALKSSKKTTTQSAFSNLRLVLPLYQEEVHLLSNKSIKSIQDLEGKEVGVGQVGGGTHVTATKILNTLGIKVIPNNKLSPVDAYKALLFGKLDAVFFVSGKPIGHIQGMMEMNTQKDLKEMAGNIHLLAIKDDRLNGTYAKATIEPNDYVSKNGQHKLTKITTPTVSVTAALVTRTLPEKGTWTQQKRCRQINKVHRALSNKIKTLASGGRNKKQYHQKWKTVDFTTPFDLEQSRCIETTDIKKAVVQKPAVEKVAVEKTETANVEAPVIADPSKVAVPLSSQELAEANCLLLTNKPCVDAAPAEVEEPLPTLEQLQESLTGSTEPTSDLAPVPSL